MRDAIVKDNTGLQAEVKRLRRALELIDSIKAVDVEGGPEDMEPEAKKFCAAFGACVGIAHEALDPDYYGR